MISQEIRKKIQNLKYIECEKPCHQGQQLSVVCLNTECENNRLSCCHCQLNEHHQHMLIPLKQYILHIYEERHYADSSNFIPPQSGYTILENASIEPLKPNYFSHIQLMQNQKISAIKKLYSIKQRFCQQIQQVRAKIEVNTTKYIEKIKILSEIYYENCDIVKKYHALLDKPHKISSMIDTYVQNLLPPKQTTSIDSRSCNSDSQHQQSTRRQTVLKQFKTITQSFQSKVTSFQESLSKFDFLFLPKISKKIFYENIKFSAQNSKYKWNPSLKSQYFEVVEPDRKLIRVKSSASNGERVALMEEEFSNSSYKKFQWAIKINKLVGWIGVGVSLKSIVTQAQFKFNHTTLGHGNYLISGNGYTWSHSQAQNNSKSQSFPFGTGDIIVLQYDSSAKQILFKKIKNNLIVSSFVLKVAEYPENQTLCPCVNMYTVNDQVEIIPIPKEID